MFEVVLSGLQRTNETRDMASDTQLYVTCTIHNTRSPVIRSQTLVLRQGKNLSSCPVGVFVVREKGELSIMADTDRC